jgi:hypothetical protein
MSQEFVEAFHTHYSTQRKHPGRGNASPDAWASGEERSVRCQRDGAKQEWEVGSDGKKKRAAGNPLSAGGSQGPLLLPKAEDTGNLRHVFRECKSNVISCRSVDFTAFSGILMAA